MIQEISTRVDLVDTQTLQPWHREVARLMTIGFSLGQIAVQTGVPVAELTQLTRQTQFRELTTEVAQEIKQTTTELRLRLEMAAQGALDTIIDLMGSARSEMVKRMCALDVIDRAGYGAVQKHEVTQTVVIDDKRADLIIQTSKEIGKGALVGTE